MENLYIPELQPSLKHPTVFKKFDALPDGESLLLINDHDPIPLFYEMKAERGDNFEWIKVKNGPEEWRVEIKKTGASNNKTSKQHSDRTIDVSVFTLNVTLIEPRLKHPTIFRHFDELAAGKSFQILNDHDPKPLYYQLIAERGNIFSWTYLEKGPVWWKVQIRKNDPSNGETVGAIAAKDLRKAEVFKKYGIDFCCGGKKSLKQACEEKGLDLTAIETALNQSSTQAPIAENSDRWNIDFLADYIYNKHHLFYYDEEPVISDLLAKVTNHHAAHHPELLRVYQVYQSLVSELNAHFIKEERVLFPFIKELVRAKQTGEFEALGSFRIQEPVQMMEADHEAAGELLSDIRKSTNDYQVPEGGCNSFKLLYHKLEELESDLHTHIHLENNILFPKALALDKELTARHSL